MRPMPELTVVEVPTESLVPYANNAKIHTDEQVGQIAKSIEEFGFNDPIAVWENASGETEIIEGHGRVLAAKKLGIANVPIIYLNHLTDEQRRAYTHVHNQLTLNSNFDIETLSLDLQELDFDFEELGFDALAIAESDTESYMSGDEEDDSIDEYDGEELLVSYNVIICCEDENDKQHVAKMLGVDLSKRLYHAKELIGEVSDTDV